MQEIFAALQHFAFGYSLLPVEVAIVGTGFELTKCLDMHAVTSTARTQPQLRSAYPVFCSITTRWADNDVYGHVNNVVYYGWFDTAVNAYLISKAALDIHSGQTIGLVVETQ